MINSNDKNAITNLLETTQYKKKDDLLSSSEYREHFNGDRLYSNVAKTESYVSKRANDESEFWKGGKYAYNDSKMKEEIVYKTMSRTDFSDHQVPENFKSKEHNMRVTRISEYSNALYNNNVFKNPSFLSC